MSQSKENFRRVSLEICTIILNITDLTGEYEDRDFVVKRGDSRITMTIARNKDTVKFVRENRFLIDDPESSQMLSYQLTKPLKVGTIYNDCGVYNFVLQEVASTDNDNYELGIADYYLHFPKHTEDMGGDGHNPPTHESGDVPTSDKEVWL